MDLSRRSLLASAAGSVAVETLVTAVPASAMRMKALSGGEALTVSTPDGLSLSARIYGDATHPELLFIHGLGQSRLCWDRQVQSLLSSNFRIITFDLRGHGDSSKPDDAKAYSDGRLWADDLKAVIAAAGLRRPVLVGWSLGGLVTGQYLVRHGQSQIGGVNLVDAVTRLSPGLLSQTAKSYAVGLASTDLAVRTAAIAGFLAACFATPPVQADFRQMLVYNGMVPRVVQEAIVHIGNDGLDEAFGAVRNMLVTYGGKDKLTMPAMSRRILDLNHSARWSVYKNSGHTPFYEESGRFNTELRAFALSALYA